MMEMDHFVEFVKRCRKRSLFKNNNEKRGTGGRGEGVGRGRGGIERDLSFWGFSDLTMTE